MRRNRAQSIEIHMVQHMYRVADNNHMNDDAAKIKNMFHRVHRKARPWTNVDVAVMDRMPTPE